MKNSESLKEFKKLNSEQITEKIDQLRKDLFDLRFKQATRQLNETHKFKIIKKQVALVLTITALTTSDFLTPMLGRASFTVATITSPTCAYLLLEPKTLIH